MNRQYPMKGQAEQIRSQGRYGDDVLVHMNSAELKGLASMFPGQLTTNPETGQPEAFAFMIPMLASYGASTAASAGLLGSMAPWLAGGIASGLSTAAVTGDLERGLVSGVMGAGIGAAAGAAGSGADAATKGVEQAAANAAVNSGTGIAENATAFLDTAEQAAVNASANAPATIPYAAGTMQPGISGLPSATTNMFADIPGGPAQGMSQTLKNQWTGDNNMLTQMSKQRSLLPFAIGAGQLEQYEQQDNMAGSRMRRQKEADEKRRNATNIMGDAYGHLGYPGYAEGGRTTSYNPLAEYLQSVTAGETSARPPGGGGSSAGTSGGTREAEQAAAGGSDTEKSPDNNNDNRTGDTNYGETYTGSTTPAGVSSTDNWTPEDWLRFISGARAGLTGPGYGTTSPGAVQTSLHTYSPGNMPFDVVRPPSDYLPGVNPEFAYFQPKGQNYVPEYGIGPYAWMDQYHHPYSSPINRFNYGWPDFWPEQYKPQSKPYFGSTIAAAQGKGGQSQPDDSGGPTPGDISGSGNPGGVPGTDFGRNLLDLFTGLRGGTGGTSGGGSWMDYLGIGAQPGTLPNANPQQAALAQQMQQYVSALSSGGQNRYLPIGRVGGQNMAAGGIAEMGPGAGTPPPGGIGSLPAGMSGPPMPPQQPPMQPPMQQGQGPNPEELQMVAAAIAGMAGEQGQQIIDMFIQKYGPDVFQQIRQAVLQMIQPNAQTEGMVKGPGGGMDDQVPGMIGAQQPVAVSPGEYIVPADVVSGIGDGSSDAGAQELDRMSDDIRMARGGNTKQPPALNARRYMPA